MRTYNPETTWFIADTHFWHTNIIQYENRTNFLGRFRDVKEMNEFIIKEWNKYVDLEDTVFHLGDFSWGSNTQWQKIRSQLNGNIHLIRGNHDYNKSNSFLTDIFDTVSDYKEIYLEFNDEKIPVVLSHYPLYSWNKQHYGAWHLFGHVHRLFSSIPGLKNNLNVGYDSSGIVSGNQIAVHFYKEFIENAEN